MILTVYAADSDPEIYYDKVNLFAKMISEYGWSSVVLAVMLIILLGLFIHLLRSNNNYRNQINDLNKHLMEKQDEETNKISNFIDEITDSQKFHKSSRRGISEFININAILKKSCKETLTKLKCSRVAVYVFHNGNTSLHGFSFYKMSCVGEWSSNPNGVTRGMTHYQMPLHMFDDIITELFNNSEFFIQDVTDKCLANDSIYHFICNTRIRSFYMKSIDDEEGNPAGFSICEFNIRSGENDDVIRQSLTDLNNKISSIILSSNIEDLVDGASR